MTTTVYSRDGVIMFKSKALNKLLVLGAIRVREHPSGAVDIINSGNWYVVCDYRKETDQHVIQRYIACLRLL